jgi:hypothetical protein
MIALSSKIPTLTAADWARLERKGWPGEHRFLHVLAQDMTPLMFAAREGQSMTKLASRMIERGANVGQTDSNGKTAGWYCKDLSGLLPALLAAGLDPNHRNSDGNTALDELAFWVFEYGDFEGKHDLDHMAVWIEHGADIDTPGGNGDSFRDLFFNRADGVVEEFDHGIESLLRIRTAIEARDLGVRLPVAGTPPIRGHRL